ncbi:hypothetical protein QQP08_014766 [Theobroma cacao]|nr:hypothetical protein QQP08_014766 [Theobroma cacao]
MLMSKIKWHGFNQVQLLENCITELLKRAKVLPFQVLSATLSEEVTAYCFENTVLQQII